MVWEKVWDNPLSGFKGAKNCLPYQTGTVADIIFPPCFFSKNIPPINPTLMQTSGHCLH